MITTGLPAVRSYKDDGEDTMSHQRQKVLASQYSCTPIASYLLYVLDAG